MATEIKQAKYKLSTWDIIALEKSVKACTGTLLEARCAAALSDLLERASSIIVKVDIEGGGK